MVVPRHGILARSRNIAKKSKRELINKTLDEDYPGLDYLGFHDVLVAKKRWYCYGWFVILFLCVVGGISTTVTVISEYLADPQVTRVQVKSVDNLALPFLSICPTEPTVNVSRFSEYIDREFPNLFTNRSADATRLARFIIAGSGFQKQNVKMFGNITEYGMIYDRIRGQRSILEFFQFFFDEFGPTCTDIFSRCTLSNQIINCCEKFKIFYAIRRGRCFRLRNALTQTTFDEQGKLKIEMKAPVLIDGTESTELIAFLEDERVGMAPFPRYYLYRDKDVRLQVKATRMDLLEAEDVCSNEKSMLAKSTCFLDSWFTDALEKPFNCSYPYMNKVRPVDVESCHPVTVVANYEKTVLNPDFQRHECKPSCKRWEYSATLERVDLKNPFSPFRVDVYYNDLQYEEFTALNQVTFMGLLSQIGGQLSLFLGSSILSIVQLAILGVVVSRRVAKQMKRRSTVSASGTKKDLGRTSKGMMTTFANISHSNGFSKEDSTRMKDFNLAFANPKKVGDSEVTTTDISRF